MVTVKYDDLLFGFEWVNASPDESTRAYVSLETGAVFREGPEGGDEVLPEDLHDASRYVSIPHKVELDLGSRLPLRFADERLPHRYSDVRAIFRSKGAYSRFKSLLIHERALDEWYAYQDAAVREALTKWAADNGLNVDVGGDAPIG